MCVGDVVLRGEAGEVRVLEGAGVRGEVRGGGGEEVGEGEEEERRGEDEPEGGPAGAREDGAGEGRDADVEDAGGERLVGGDERLYAVCGRLDAAGGVKEEGRRRTFDGLFDADPARDDALDLGAGVEVGGGHGSPRGADVLLELGGRLNEQDVLRGCRVDGELGVGGVVSGGCLEGGRAHLVPGGLGHCDRGSGGGEDGPALLAGGA